MEVKVQIKSVDGEAYPAEMDRLSNSIMAGVDIAMERVSQNTMAFDPRTGEPLYCAPYPDLGAAQLVSRMHVFSPTAMTQLLQRDFAGYDDDGSAFAPILMATPDED